MNAHIKIKVLNFFTLQHMYQSKLDLKDFIFINNINFKSFVGDICKRYL